MEGGEPNKKTVEEWRNIYLQRFQDLHDNWSDEIPEEMIHSDNPVNNRYKVRGNWFATIKSNFENCKTFKIFPEEFNEEWKSFFKTYTLRMMSSKEEVRTTKEEIDAVNKLLIKAQEIISNSK